MNYAIPILVCHQNDDFRSHLREMLTKHGFFHVIEAATEEEMKTFLTQEKDFFAIVEAEMADHKVLSVLNERKSGFLFLTKSDSPKTMDLAVQMGVSHLLSFPFSSQQLVEMIIKDQ